MDSPPRSQETTLASRSGEALATIRFRPIGPADQIMLREFHDRLSEATIRRRFHAAKPHLSQPLANRLASVDGRDAVGFVALTTHPSPRIVGVGRYCRLDSVSAEIALVVQDGYQGHGIGTELMRLLIAEARVNAITRLFADVLPENTTMLHLLFRFGKTEIRRGYGVEQVLLAI